MRRLFPLLLPTLLLLSACGFHLRGSLPAAEADAVGSVHVQERRAGDVAREVKAQLQAARVAVTAEAEPAEYILNLSNARVERNVLSVSPQTGKAEEYQLLLTLRMSVRRGEAVLVDSELIEIARDYTFDEDAALGKFSEEQVLQEEMNRLAADRIIRRLNAAARNE